MKDKPKLIDMSRPREFVLNQSEITIGREKDNDIILENENVSRRHARISRRMGRFYLSDLASKNGTSLNGEIIKKAVMRDGDEIRLGDAAFRFSCRTAPRSKKPLYMAVLMGLAVFMVFALSVTIHKRTGARQSGINEAESLYEEGMKDYLARNEDAGNIRKALIKWKRALVLNPSFTALKESIAQARAELDDIAEGYYLAGDRLSREGHFKKAIERWEKIKEITEDDSHPLYKKAQARILELRKKLE